MAHGASRNLIRKALNRLAGQGLVDAEPQFGCSVRGRSAPDLEDLVAQRVLPEGIALRRCIARSSAEWHSEVLAAHHRLRCTPMKDDDGNRLDPLWLERHDDVHRVMLEGCGSARLFPVIRQMAEAAEPYHRALLPVVARDAEMDAEHAELLAAILAGGADEAVRILTPHLEETRDFMLPLLRASTGPRLSAPIRSEAPVAWTGGARRAPYRRR